MNIPEDLTQRERSTLIVAGWLAVHAEPMDGGVPGGAAAIARELGIRRVNVYPPIAALVARRLLRRMGHTLRARLVVVDLVCARRQVGSGGGGGSGRRFAAGTDDAKWRARVGGYERAMREVQAQRDAAKAEADALRRGRRMDADPSIAALLLDIEHTVDCCAPSCARCHKIGRKAEAARADYATEAEIVDKLERATSLEMLCVEVIAAHRDRSPGAMQRRGLALRALAAVLPTPGELGERA